MALPCPTGGNLAAIAKQLHATALDAEAKIYDLEQQLRAAANRPTIIQTTTVLQTGLSAGVISILEPAFGGGTWVETFNNTVLASDESISNNGDTFTVLGEGMYEIGWSGNIIPSGVVTANSFRAVSIEQHTPDPLTLGTVQNGFREVNRVSVTEFESNVGNGVDFSLVGEFRISPGDRIFFTLQHANVGSTLNLSIGAIGWLHRISDATITAVL